LISGATLDSEDSLCSADGTNIPIRSILRVSALKPS